MNAYTTGLAPLLQLAGQLEDVSHQIGDGVLAYEPPEAVAYARYALLLAAGHLTEVLEHMAVSDD